MALLTDSEKSLNQQFAKAFDYLLEHKDQYEIKDEKDLCNKIGIHQTNLAKYKGRKRDGSYVAEDELRVIPIQSVINMITTYNLNGNYFLIGEGEMFRELQDYSKKSDKKEESQSVPLYDFEAAAGLMKLFTSKPNILEHITIPNLPKCDGAIHVSGDSMYPLLKSGDIVIYKQVHDIHGSILYGNMYLISCIIDGEDYTLVKYIHESDKGEQYVKLVSQNQYHKPIEVLKDNILALAYIKASIRINSMS